MDKIIAASTLMVLGLIAPATWSPAQARAAGGPAVASTPTGHPPSAATPGATATAPDYTSGLSAGLLTSDNYNTPEADGRPGAKFFAYGVAALKQGDLKHAVDMFKVSASWAYKPAEYNLGVIYFQGEYGAQKNRPLGAAWMVLAAERGDSMYVKARDMMISALSESEFARTDELWGQLRQTYGDDVALRRAKAQWARAKYSKTGSHIGGVSGELHVGVTPARGAFATAATNDGGAAPIQRHGAMSVLPADSIDGSKAYRQFERSSNPYDPAFLKDRTGVVSVGALQTGSGPGGRRKPGNPDPASSTTVDKPPGG